MSLYVYVCVCVLKYNASLHAHTIAIHLWHNAYCLNEKAQWGKGEQKVG